MQTSDAILVAKLAFEFLVGRGPVGQWAEIDRTEGMWTIPSTRMKVRPEHRVALCHRAMETLDEPRLDDGANALVFTRSGGKLLAGSGIYGCSRPTYELSTEEVTVPKQSLSYGWPSEWYRTRPSIR